MLIQLVANHPEAIGPIIRNTPSWVWGYGAFTGVFIGRAARLWRLALRTPATLAAA